MNTTTVAAWVCDPCEVTGRTPTTEEPQCWNCGGPVVITARPVVPLGRNLGTSENPAA